MNAQLSSGLDDLLDPAKGFIVKRGFLMPEEADRYREECRRFLTTTRQIYKNIHRYCKRDYIWSTTGKVIPGEFTYRIYQSLHSRHSAETETMFQNMLTLRNEIEGNWLHDDEYRNRREGLYDYVQVTTYGKRSRGIDKHADYKGGGRYPLLQCLVFLSEPDVDYLGGDLVLHTKEGIPIHIQKTLRMKKGDALLFDKSLYHEVEPTEPSALSDVGRWTVVIGARYPKPPSVFDRIKNIPGGMVEMAKRPLRPLLRPIIGGRRVDAERET